MAHSENRLKKTREIIYHVGMTKGKICYDERGNLTSHESAHALLDNKLFKTLELFVWKEAPLFPRKSVYYLLWVLPLVSCTLSFWLVFVLFNVHTK